MLEEKNYTMTEISEILGSRSNQAIEKKLERYNIEYTCAGRGKNATYSITKINDPFKIYCITELKFTAQTDFDKLLIFLYYFLNNDEFRAMPDEVKEARLNCMYINRPTRQTMHKYERRLDALGYFAISSNDFIYYFAHKKTQTLTTREIYSKAWREYFELKDISGGNYVYAMKTIIQTYGGVPKKQGLSMKNAFYLAEIDYLNNLVIETFEEKIMNTDFSQTINTNNT